VLSVAAAAVDDYAGGSDVRPRHNNNGGGSGGDYVLLSRRAHAEWRPAEDGYTENVGHLFTLIDFSPRHTCHLTSRTSTLGPSPNPKPYAD